MSDNIVTHKPHPCPTHHHDSKNEAQVTQNTSIIQIRVNRRSSLISTDPGFSHLGDQETIYFQRPGLQDKGSCPCLQSFLHGVWVFFFTPLKLCKCLMGLQTSILQHRAVCTNVSEDFASGTSGVNVSSHVPSLRCPLLNKRQNKMCNSKSSVAQSI